MAVIVEAAAQVLARRGWAGFTTAEVAERAGVSIGSVYQYFRQREALLEAVRDRHSAQLMPCLAAVAASGLSFSQRARLLVDGLIAAHRDPPGLHHSLADVTQALHVSEMSVRLETAYSAAFVLLAGKADPADARIAVVAAALEGAIHDAARRDRLDDPRTRSAILAIIETLRGRSDTKDDDNASSPG